MGATSTHRPRRILREVDRMTGRLKVGVHCITVTDGARVTYAVDGAGEPVLVLLRGKDAAVVGISSTGFPA